MASGSLPNVEKSSEKRLKRIFCDHCLQLVSRTTFYRHQILYGDGNLERYSGETDEDTSDSVSLPSIEENSNVSSGRDEDCEVEDAMESFQDFSEREMEDGSDHHSLLSVSKVQH